MTNPNHQVAVDPNKSPKQNLLNLINKIGGTNFTELSLTMGDVTFPDPDHPEKAQVTLTAVPEYGYTGTTTFKYQRRDINQIPQNLLDAPVEIGTPSPKELVAAVEQELGLYPDQIEITGGAIQNNGTVELTILEDSVFYFGSTQFTIKLTATIPGPEALSNGDSSAGFFGEVTQDELIHGTDLASKINLTAGTPADTNANWLKFAWQDKILFVAMRSLRYGVSWNEIYHVGAVYGNGEPGGDAKIIIGNNYYNVRLLTGTNNDPTLAPDGGLVSEYGDKGEFYNLIGRVFAGQMGTWAQYDQNDLNLEAAANGNATSCQETSGSNAVFLNYSDHIYLRSKSDTSSYRGWRPVLEFVGPVAIPNAPGPANIIAGDASKGTFGYMGSYADLISRADLQAAVGFSSGKIEDTYTEGWLKFIYQGKILFVSKGVMRTSWAGVNISKDDLLNANLVYGDANAPVLTIGDFKYKVRLLTGGDGDPASNPGGEWNDLIYPMSASDPTGRNWDSLTDHELDLQRPTTCQETRSGSNTLIYRGDGSLTGFGASGYCTWRPVLELVT